jgi:hypothetical protein
MGQKLCAGSNDTPLVTLDCTFISVTRSPNTNIDITDSPVQEEEEEKDPQYKRCCCLLWRRRHRKENGREKMKATKKKKETLAFQIIPSTLPTTN